MRENLRKDVLRRLARIEGQIRGLAGMAAEDRYCIDIVTQSQAARAALARVEALILQDHVETCVQHALDSDDPADRRRKVDELMDVLAPGKRQGP